MRGEGRSDRLMASVLAAGVVVAPAWSGPTFEEIPDAGSTVGTAQPVTGPAGGVGRIKGELTATADSFDFEDVYLICITDAVGFSAVVDPTGTDFDTQLWLFSFNGFGLLSNNNDPISFPTIFSRVQPPATDGTGQIVPGPGLYFLAITSKHNNALSGLGPIFNDQSFNGTEISGPDGIGAGQPLQFWSHGAGTVGGTYAINLTGVKFLDLPCDVACPPGAITDADAFQCGLTPDPNGGCNEAGNPLQNLGTLSPSNYRAACGTTGTVLPNARDLDWYRFHLDAPAFVKATLVHNIAEGIPAPNIELYIVRGDQCATEDIVFDGISGACPFVSDTIPLPAGDHVAIVSVDAFGPEGPACPVEYLLWLTAAAGDYPVCGSAGAGPCGQAHPSPGCGELGCCESVCAIEPACCELAWDSTCVSMAFALCLGSPYACAPFGGAPPNDCATDPAPLAIDSSASFLTDLASTDGPSDDAAACTPGNDVWYRVFVPAPGKLHLSLCGTASFDTTMAVYELGASPLVDPTQVFDGTHLVACDDDGCGTVGGSSELEINAPIGGRWYLVRVGGYISAGVPASGVGTITASFVHLVFTTGPTHTVLFDLANTGAFTLSNVGISSGKISLAQPQRWLAQPFTVPPGPNGSGYALTEIHGYGFSPAGSVNQTLNYIVWKRTRTLRPIDGDQLATGAVPFPIPTDLPDGAPANEDHLIALPSGPQLPSGNYWLTLYANNAGPPNDFANFAWYLGADQGINVLDPGLNPFAWRSAMFPLPGFLQFTLPATTLQQHPGYDLKDLYNTGFTLCGMPLPPQCVGDINGDGAVDGMDLAMLLSGWGGTGSANLDGVGVVDAADLALLLGGWGPCR